MQKTVSFKKKVIATTIASLAAGFGSLAYAQNNAGETEEIVVTGIKASLDAAMDIKKNAVGVVDAISAEDIGKMPDTNLAESLQRIPGVSIDRSNGEGSKVTVRGLAGDYNLVTINGRQMPAASSADTTRSFDFANLASEGVSGVEVYKSGRSDVQSGGMGALINITTPRPLEHPGLKASVGVKAVYDQSTETGHPTPEFSGIYSDTFLDDTLGVAVTGSYQQRESGERSAYAGGWFTYDKNNVGQAGSWAGTGNINKPSGKTYALPVNVGYQIQETQRTRLNSQLTVQYKPVDTLTVTADYLYVNQDVDNQRQATGVWFNRAGDAAQVKWSDTNPSYPITYTEHTGRHEIDNSMQYTQEESNLKSAGLNVKWDATEHLKLELDGHNSTSYWGPNGKYGNGNTFNYGVYDDYAVTADFSGKIPKLSVGYYNAPQKAVPDLPRVQLTNNAFENRFQDTEVDEYQLKGTYSFDDSILANVKAGAGSTDVSNRSFKARITGLNQGSWGGIQGNDGIGDIPQQFWKIDYLSNHFSGGGLDSPGAYNAFIKADWHDLLAIGSQLYGSNTYDPKNSYFCPNSYCTTWDPKLANDGYYDRNVEEKSTYGYLQFNFKTDILEMPANLSVGVRHEQTKVDSDSLLPNYTPYIRWNSGNEFSLLGDGFRTATGKGDYSKTLPSVDFDIGLTDTVKARASFSKSIARPNYDHLKAGYVWDSARKGAGTGSTGNPDLNPLESTNYDLSVEWYYADSSYVSVGAFKKNVVDFIGDSPLQVADSGFHTVVNGPRWKAAQAAGKVTDDEILNYILANYPQSSDVPNRKVYALGEDPILPFVLTQRVNNKEANIDGFEVALQHTFGDSGFGFQANATKVKSDVNFDNVSVGDQFAIYGLSDSANLIAFYDKDAWQARVAYNWRDKFLNGNWDNLSGATPRYTEAYGQVDASISYEFSENFVITLEGINVTNESQRVHGREDHLILNYAETGARYNLGARYTF